MAEAKQRLELETAAETLAREARTAKSVDQLPRLEAAILAAKRVGAEILDQESYNLASETRERLAQAFRVRTSASVFKINKMDIFLDTLIRNIFFVDNEK